MTDLIGQADAKRREWAASDLQRQYREFAAREEKAKADLRYAMIKSSERRWRIIQFAGFEFDGEQQIPIARFEFITPSLSYSEAKDRLTGYITSWPSGESNAKAE
jgi:hypothetical protein